MEEVSISWSSLRIHEECRAKAHLLRMGRRSPFVDKRVFFPGTLSDIVMRTWLRDESRRPGAMPGMVDEWLERAEREALENGDGVVRWRGPGDRESVREFCKELVTRLEPILERHVLPYSFEAEKRFSATVRIPYLDGYLTDIQLVGGIDILTRSNVWTVWDLKASSNNGYWRKVLGQLTFYAIAVEALTGERPAKVGLFQPMCDDPVPVFVPTEDDYQQLWGRIIKMAEDMWRQDFLPKKGSEGCLWCEVRHACPKYPRAGKTRSRLTLDGMRAVVGEVVA